MICACGKEFARRANAKTCSPQCSEIRKTRRERSYVQANRPRIRLIEQRYLANKRFDRRLNRAVRVLFALTGETHDNL